MNEKSVWGNERKVMKGKSVWGKIIPNPCKYGNSISLSVSDVFININFLMNKNELRENISYTYLLFCMPFTTI
jgi:hypothetical protein